MLGDLGVGKTTLIRKYTGEELDEGGEQQQQQNSGSGNDYKVSTSTTFSIKRVSSNKAEIVLENIILNL